MASRKITDRLAVVAAAFLALSSGAADGENAEVGAKRAAPSGNSGVESNRPEKARPFATPVWHPDAEWKTTGEVLAGSQATGFLDGPRREVMWSWGGLGLGQVIGMTTGGRSLFETYDPETERIHTMAGSSHGYLDGPFSRARLGGWDYSHRGSSARSPDGRFHYFVDPWNGRLLRGLDLEKQVVFTVSREPIANIKGLSADGKGRLLVVKADGEMLMFSPDSEKPEAKKLELPEGAFSGQTLSLAFDPVHDRLYSAPSFKMSKKWYLWYWDMKDFSHHGVLPAPQEGEPARKGGMGASEAGPFKGTKLYPECYVAFGPDDPEYRFLYMRCTDQWALYRLDLVKEEIHALSYDKEKQVFRFIASGMPANGPGGGGLSLGPSAEGDFSYGTDSYKGVRVFRVARVR